MQKINFPVFFLSVILVFILVLNFTPLGKGLRNFFYSFSYPIQARLWNGGNAVSSFFSAIFRGQNIQKENEEQRIKIEELSVQIRQLSELRRENENLKTALGLELSKDFDLQMSEFISQDPSGDFLIISGGKKDGLAEGMTVITSSKVLIGRISEVFDGFSRVQLLTAKTSSFDVEISERDAYGLARGKGNFSLVVERIPQDKEIKEGDIIYTSQLGGNYPEGLLVGQIISIKKTDVESFQKAEIKIAFDADFRGNPLVIKNFKSR